MINLTFKWNGIKNNHFFENQVDKFVILCYNIFVDKEKRNEILNKK